MAELNKLLADALADAAIEMEDDYGWDFHSDDSSGSVSETFLEVFVKHLAPLLDKDAYRQSRIAALRAELRALEDDEP